MFTFWLLISKNAHLCLIGKDHLPYWIQPRLLATKIHIFKPEYKHTSSFILSTSPKYTYYQGSFFGVRVPFLASERGSLHKYTNHS
jgi:hypothetical protein